jgi:hypothetical protein
LEDRDSFAERLREKDKEKTKTLGGSLSKKRLEEAKRREQMAKEDRKKMIPKLREEARYEYLGDRKGRKLDELLDDIKDEEFLFGGELTEVERAKLDQKRKVYELAKQHDELDSQFKIDGYEMPRAYIDEDRGTRDRKSQVELLERRSQNEYDETLGASYDPSSFGHTPTHARHCVCVCLCVSFLLHPRADRNFSPFRRPFSSFLAFSGQLQIRTTTVGSRPNQNGVNVGRNERSKRGDEGQG